MSTPIAPIGGDEMRTHVVLPKELVERIDARVGPRRRSRFIAELTTRELARLETLEAARAAAGSLPEGTVPEWDTDEDLVVWLRDLRRADDARQERLDRLRASDDPTP